MLDVTNILAKIQSGDRQASSDLLPMVYDELRRLASQRMSSERADHTLQATALVHEAYVRLVDAEQVQSWDSRGHFFSAATEAMRRILVEHARKKGSQKRNAVIEKIDLDSVDIAQTVSPDALLKIDEALARFEAHDPEAYQIVMLRYFGGMRIEDAAKFMEISPRTAYRNWNYARAWLSSELLCREA